MQNPTNGRPVGAPEPPSVVPNAAQLSREAKHMRVMLMLCVKEKVFDQAALESIFSQWLLCEQQNEGHVEETDAAFRRSLGRTYGPRSKDFLGAIDRAKVKLEQLKERKSRGELGSGGSIGGVPPPNLPPSSMGNPQIGMPGQMGGQIGGQPFSNQPPTQMMSHQSLGQMPHLAQPQQPPPQPHLIQQHPPQQYPPQHTQQHPPHPHPSQHPSQQHPPQHPPQHIGQPTLGNPQYYKPHTQQTLQQKQQQHQPPLQQSHLGLEAQTRNLVQSPGSAILQLNFRLYSFHNGTSAYYDLTSDEGDKPDESLPLPPRKRQKSSVESPSIFSEECIVEGLLQQYECAICFEVMACAYCISPCGDCFCYECLEEWAGQSKKGCPQCRGRFDLRRAIPMKRIDNAIRETLKHRTQQLAAWEKRVEEGLKKQKA